MAHWGFNYGELVDYAAQDAVYRFPDDWKERWPNVAASQECVPGAAVAEESAAAMEQIHTVQNYLR